METIILFHLRVEREKSNIKDRSRFEFPVGDIEYNFVKFRSSDIRNLFQIFSVSNLRLITLFDILKYVK